AACCCSLVRGGHERKSKHKAEMALLAGIVMATWLAETRLSHATLVRPWGLSIDPLAEVAVHSVQRGSACSAPLTP
ncbi:MAG: hypothetical protein KC492_42840, partial [Myxococcales bacterium]|nr:hypothetical protein [Myxococcales bacterium]